MTPTAGALAGVKILDLSRILAGPWATQLLADLGAEVIKVERPDSGDDTRTWGPPYASDGDGNETTESAYFLSANRNKKSVAVDLAKAGGQRVIRELAADCDIFVENFRVGALAQYGLAYEHIRAVNPRIVYCSISGFGQDGPYANRAGYDFLVQGMGGLMSVTGEPDGRPGGGPQKAGVALTDVLTGMYAAVGILSAIIARGRTGQGQHIDIALLDVQVASLANQALNYLVSGCAPGRLGNAHPNIVPYQTVPTEEGNMILAVGNDAQFRRCAGVLGHPEWGEDSRFMRNADRVANREELMRLISECTRRKPASTWIAQLEVVGVPCGPVNDVAAVFRDPQVIHRGMRIGVDHPTAGELALVANPLKLSETPVTYRHAPPLLGQHTREILASRLGMTSDEISNLLQEGSVR